MTVVFPDVIAIDGPAASGKSTVARRVAAALGFTYADSGSFYRGAAWLVLGLRGSRAETHEIIDIVRKSEFSCYVENGAVVFTLNGDLPGQALRSREVEEIVSRVASIPEVRTRIVGELRGLLMLGNLVMEGRDIGSNVFPETPYKFYLDASPEERARRRQAERDGEDVVAVGERLKSRDRMDSSRAANPLKVAADAVVIDTTGLGIDQVVAAITARYRNER